MIKAAHVKTVTHRCQKFGAAFRGIFSVTLMHRRAVNRLERVKGRAAALAVNILNLIRVNQALAMQTAGSRTRPHELSHFWLHSANPYNP